MHQHRLNMQKIANKRFSACSFQLATLQHACNVATLQLRRLSLAFATCNTPFRVLQCCKPSGVRVAGLRNFLHIARRFDQDWPTRNFPQGGRAADRARETRCGAESRGNVTP